MGYGNHIFCKEIIHINPYINPYVNHLINPYINPYEIPYGIHTESIEILGIQPGDPARDQPEPGHRDGNEILIAFEAFLAVVLGTTACGPSMA